MNKPKQIADNKLPSLYKLPNSYYLKLMNEELVQVCVFLF